jgi:YbgC/YbaW family acyl-CoA thioester hydrolase
MVEFGDTDMAGIAHFANFFRWMEAAEHALLRSLGLTVAFAEGGQKYGLPRVAASCDYLRPVRFGDELAVTVAVEKLGRSSVTYAFDFTHGGDAIARGKITAVFCRFDGKPEAQELPPAFREKLEQVKA